MKSTENDTNIITSSNAITPDGKLLNIEIKENIVKISEILGKNHIAINTPIVKTHAIIWFSVTLDANIPKAIYALLNKKNPKSVQPAIAKLTVPKYAKIAKWTNVNNIVIKITASAAKYFPRTIDTKLLGEVSKSCSVPISSFLSKHSHC